jgi:hypothetical protein
MLILKDGTDRFKRFWLDEGYRKEAGIRKQARYGREQRYMTRCDDERRGKISRDETGTGYWSRRYAREDSVYFRACFLAASNWFHLIGHIGAGRLSHCSNEVTQWGWDRGRKRRTASELQETCACKQLGKERGASCRQGRRPELSRGQIARKHAKEKRTHGVAVEAKKVVVDGFDLHSERDRSARRWLSVDGQEKGNVLVLLALLVLDIAVSDRKSSSSAPASVDSVLSTAIPVIAHKRREATWSVSGGRSLERKRRKAEKEEG